TPGWDNDILLKLLTEGLFRHGEDRLGSLAAACAYSRSRDGWRSFGGSDARAVFLQSLSHDSAVAWQILAEEVAEAVARGGDYGVTVHLIEILAAGGLVDAA